MKNSQKGFIVPVLLVIIAVLVIGGGVYIYESKKVETPPVVVDTTTQPINQQTNTQTNNPPAQTDTSFKVLSPKAGDSWKIGGVYSVKFQNLPKGSFVQGWLQDKNGASTGTASIGVIDTGRDGNPSSNIQITVPSQWCGGECGAVEYVTPGQYRLLLRIYPNVNNSSYQTFYSDYFTLMSNQTVSSTNDISSLQFTYGSDVFALKKAVASTGINVYEFRAGDTSTVRVYTFVPNDTTVYAQGILGGVDTKLFILWRGSGANIIEPILFAFRKNGDVWKQTAYTKLPQDGGRTTIESFSIGNDSIVLYVKTSGPDRNYHETYVPKHYVYKLSGNQLLLQ